MGARSSSLARPPTGRDSPVFRIGISGHRLDKLAGVDTGRLRARLGELLAAIDSTLARDGRACLIVSPLAEGVDRLAVDSAPAHWPLIALLPMPRAIYREDFLSAGEATSPSAEAFDAYLARAASVTELPMLQAQAGLDPRPAQYEALGHALVRQIDCLVAVWDGSPPRGPGGTGHVAREASELGLPLLRIHPAGDCPVQTILGFRGGDLASPEFGPAGARAMDALAARGRTER